MIDLPKIIFEIIGLKKGTIENYMTINTIINEIEDSTKLYNRSKIERELTEKYMKFELKYIELLEIYRKT